MMRRSSPDVGSTLEFLRLLWRVNHALERRSKHMHATLGVTAPQRMVIRMVGRMPGVSAGDLAEILYVDPGTLSNALRVLERQKLLRRTSDTLDRRRVRIVLTTRGRRLDTDTPRTVEAAVRATLAKQSSRTLSGTRRALEALARELGEGDVAVPRGRKVHA